MNSSFRQSCCLYILIRVLMCIVAVNTQHCRKPDEYASSDESCSITSVLANRRYVLYDVNPPEGFNLRRDVYVRTAIFMRNLIKKHSRYDWHLVLPPWGNLYHWRSKNIGRQTRLPWGTFFDVESLSKFVPVMEMHEFFQDFSSTVGRITLDRVYVLKNDEEMFVSGNFEDKNQLVECNDNIPYELTNDNEYLGPFWGYSNITANEVKCLIFHGTTSGLEQNLHPNVLRSVMFDRIEISLHDAYGSEEYWRARRSMRYNSALYNIANDYRNTYLHSNDVKDNTIRPLDWRKETGSRNAVGGPYLCVHLRRRDFVFVRKNSIPTIKQAASQLTKKMQELNLQIIFVATDADDYEYDEFLSHLANFTVRKYTAPDDVKELYKDGGVAIIDQIICSYARFFIGTHESTFTFRIQEDREIIGFPSNTTFNRLCGTDKCTTGGRWEIVWD